jgi:transcriptional regulator with XRE-family HTH domain
MIEAALVEEVRRLLSEGRLSQRKIALTTGVSRGTVNALALGKRVLADRRREAAEEFPPLDGPASRCHTCGAMVRMPCLACRLRAELQRRRLSAGWGGRGPTLPGQTAAAAW